MAEFIHIPVLLEACMEGLNIRPDGVYVAGTLGGGGHSAEILGRLSDKGRLIGIDRDDTALAAAGERLAAFGSRFIPVKSNFSEIAAVVRSFGFSRVDGILFDFGVSSPQLDDETRGFSYKGTAPLDMRMDRTQPLDARQVVNEWERDELKRIFYEYGEERYAGPVAAAIVRRREQAPIVRTDELVEIIKSALPAKARREDQHPARRVFQAIRIAVNGELEAIARAIPDGVELLKPGGRIAAISFHSLEDRIVKTAFSRLETGCECPPDFPVCVCGKKPVVRRVTKKPVVADEEEAQRNPRARSAKLRVAEKL